jgi:transglutaminase-like putative cysteine protease
MEAASVEYLSPTPIIDSDHPEVVRFARETVGKAGNPVDRAVKLYYRVRDGIWYDPYSPFYLPEHYRASHVLQRGRGYCVGKATLLCALGRASSIPSRLGFATVRNHLATRQLIEFLGSDLFVYHGFTEFFLAGKWVKATPAFNLELCEKHRVPPLEFNGRDDSIFHPYNEDQEKFMEYVAFHGTRPDVPLDEILAAWGETYGKERVRGWIRFLDSTGGQSWKDFYQEDVVKP